MRRKSRRTLILVASISVYLSFGAFLFKSAEFRNVRLQRNRWRREIAEFKQAYGVGDEEFSELVGLFKLQKQAEAQWDFVGSFYFVSVVLTLVGYGHQTPRTQLGKIALMM